MVAEPSSLADPEDGPVVPDVIQPREQWVGQRPIVNLSQSAIQQEVEQIMEKDKPQEEEEKKEQSHSQ